MANLLCPVQVGVEPRAYVRNAAMQAWNTSGTPAFEAFDDANFADYLLTPTRIGTTHPQWYFTVPSGLPAGDYVLVIYDAASPTVSDVPVFGLAFAWTGSALVLASDVGGIKARTDAMPVKGEAQAITGTAANFTLNDPA